MANVFESMSLEGLRLTHLTQLMAYIDERDRGGWYYGNKKQFETRHLELRKWVQDAIDYAQSEGVVFPKAKK